jgi:hypothetical protein
MEEIERKGENLCGVDKAGVGKKKGVEDEETDRVRGRS